MLLNGIHFSKLLEGDKKQHSSEGVKFAWLEYPVSLLCSNSLMYEALYSNAGIKELLLQLVDWKCLQILHDIPRFYL